MYQVGVSFTINSKLGLSIERWDTTASPAPLQVSWLVHYSEFQIRTVGPNCLPLKSGHLGPTVRGPFVRGPTAQFA